MLIGNQFEKTQNAVLILELKKQLSETNNELDFLYKTAIEKSESNLIADPSIAEKTAVANTVSLIQSGLVAAGHLVAILNREEEKSSK